MIRFDLRQSGIIIPIGGQHALRSLLDHKVGTVPTRRVGVHCQPVIFALSHAESWTTISLHREP